MLASADPIMSNMNIELTAINQCQSCSCSPVVTCAHSGLYFIGDACIRALVCPSGYVSSLTSSLRDLCTDVNECTSSPCEAGRTCSNTPGSYQCAETSGSSASSAAPAAGGAIAAVLCVVVLVVVIVILRRNKQRLAHTLLNIPLSQINIKESLGSGVFGAVLHAQFKV
jgi:hypothetical protein